MDNMDIQLDCGIPLNVYGNQEISIDLILKIQSYFAMEFLHLHNSTHLAEAFTSLALVNPSVNHLVLEKLKEWNRKEMEWPDHDGDFDHCLVFTPGPYALELSLNIRQLKFREHFHIQDLLRAFKVQFAQEKNVCKELLNHVQRLAQKRSKTRENIRLLYDKLAAEKFAFKKKKALEDEIKAMTDITQIQIIEVDQRKRQRLGKEAEVERKKRKKEENKKKVGIEKKRKTLKMGCHVTG